MQILLAAAAIALGCTLLIVGGDLLVRGASNLARLMKVSPLVIGLTVVAFGTSMPELAVSAVAAFRGSGDVALGNVVGSNFFNVLFILAVAALITPLVVTSQLIRRETPLMALTAILLYIAAWDRILSRWEGLIGVALLVLWTAGLIWASRRATTMSSEQEILQQTETEYGGESTLKPWQAILYVILGLGLLVAGAQATVYGAVSLARMLGISELVIGLTIVATGTSLPEVVASIMASLKNERDIAAGNIVGSNIFNVLAVMGTTASLAPTPVPVCENALQFDLPLMVIMSVWCVPLFFNGVIRRHTGLMMLLMYLAYLLWLILEQTQSPWFPPYRAGVPWVVALLATAALGSVLWECWRDRQRPVASS